MAQMKPYTIMMKNWALIWKRVTFVIDFQKVGCVLQTCLILKTHALKGKGVSIFNVSIWTKHTKANLIFTGNIKDSTLILAYKGWTIFINPWTTLISSQINPFWHISQTINWYHSQWVDQPLLRTLNPLEVQPFYVTTLLSQDAWLMKALISLLATRLIHMQFRIVLNTTKCAKNGRKIQILIAVCNVVFARYTFRWHLVMTTRPVPWQIRTRTRLQGLWPCGPPTPQTQPCEPCSSCWCTWPHPRSACPPGSGAKTRCSWGGKLSPIKILCCLSMCFTVLNVTHSLGFAQTQHERAQKKEAHWSLYHSHIVAMNLTMPWMISRSGKLLFLLGVIQKKKSLKFWILRSKRRIKQNITAPNAKSAVQFKSR